MASAESVKQSRESAENVDRKISDVVLVEGGIISFSLVAVGLALNAISIFNQINFGLAQVPGGKFYGYIPLGPIMQEFAGMVILDAICLGAGLFSRIIPGKYSEVRINLIAISLICLLASLAVLAWIVWSLRLSFYYY